MNPGATWVCLSRKGKIIVHITKIMHLKIEIFEILKRKRKNCDFFRLVEINAFRT
jgi:hypothetical protein